MTETLLPLTLGLLFGLATYRIVKSQEISPAFFANLSRRAVDRVTAILIFGAFILYAVLSLGKFESFNLYGTDFALFDQVIWNTLHGHLLENTIVLDAPFLLAQRFSPVLFALVPFYGAFSDPRVLVLIPALAVTSAAIPLYWLARQRVGPGLAFAIVLTFLSAPGLQYIAVSHFKEIILTLPFLMLSTLFLLQRRDVPFLVTTILALMCKEEVGFIVAGFGVYIFLIQRRYLLGTAIAIGGIAWVILLLQVVIPHFLGSSTYYYFGSGQYSATGLYEYLGTSLPEIVTNALTRPDLLAQNVLTPEKINVLVHIFLPLGIFAVFGIDLLPLALPTLGYTLLSNRQGQYVFGSEHYAPVYVFFFVAVVIGLQRFIAAQKFRLGKAAFRLNGLQAGLGVFIVTASLASHVMYGVAPLSKNFNLSVYVPTAHDTLGAQLAATIPQDAVVASQAELAPHVAQRRYLYLDFNHPCWSRIDYIFLDATRPWYGYRQTGWQPMLNSGWFDIVAQKDNYILAKRAASFKLDEPAGAQFEDGLGLTGYSLPITKTITGGQRLHLLTGWQVEAKPTERYIFHTTVEDQYGHIWAETAQAPCRGSQATIDWLPGRINYDDVFLNLPATMPPGQYRLMLSVSREPDGKSLPIRNVGGRAAGEGIELATLPIAKNKQSYTASELFIERPLFADMAEMRLMGSKPIPDQVRSGDLLQIGLYWRARNKPQGDYSITVELRDEQQKVMLTHTARPANGAYPTTEWTIGEVLLDWHDLTPSREMPIGIYEILVSLQNANGQRLGQAVLGKIKIIP